MAATRRDDRHRWRTAEADRPPSPLSGDDHARAGRSGLLAPRRGPRGRRLLTHRLSEGSWPKSGLPEPPISDEGLETDGHLVHLLDERERGREWRGTTRPRQNGRAQV